MIYQNTWWQLFVLDLENIDDTRPWLVSYGCCHCHKRHIFISYIYSEIYNRHKVSVDTQCAESTRKRAVPVQSICRPINFEGYYIYINMIGQQLTDSCKWDQLSCFRISADRQELASFYTLEQKFETNVMCWATSHFLQYCLCNGNK